MADRIILKTSDLPNVASVPIVKLTIAWEVAKRLDAPGHSRASRLKAFIENINAVSKGIEAP